MKYIHLLSTKPFSVIMKPEDVTWVRKTYGIPEKITDEYIVDRFSFLSSGNFHISLQERVGNELIKELLFTEVHREFYTGSVFLSNQYEIRSQRSCEELFVDGYYDACCVMSRSCAEYLLQDLCLELLSPEETNKEREIISEIINIGRNPGAKEMLHALGNRISEDEKKDFDVLFKNGDWVVHHRYDEMTGKKMTDKYSMKMPLFRINTATKQLEVTPVHERSTLEWNRPWEERRMALESLRSLYRMIFRRRAIDSEEAKKLFTDYTGSSSRSDSPPS